MSKKAVITCKISQHKDVYYNTNGAIWQSDTNTPVPIYTVLYQKKWYVSKDDVSILYEYVGNSKFLDYQTNLLNGLISVSSVAISIFLPEKVNTAISIITAATTFFGSPIDFKASTLNEIIEKSGYDKNTGQHSNGIVLTECISSGQTFYYIDKWSGGTMYGEGGYCGSWITNN